MSNRPVAPSSGLIFARTIPMDLEEHRAMPASGSPANTLVGRFLVAGELRVSIVTALIGAPLLIMLVRQRHMFRRQR